MSTAIIELVWAGSDLLLAELADLEFDEDPVQVERQLGFLLHNRIAGILDPSLSLVLVHEPPEFERLKAPPARPPQPDLGFVLPGNDRIIWPIEMKVLPNDREVEDYASELRNNFLTCRYAPLTGAGALLGYLLSGAPTIAFESISRAVPCELSPGFSNPPRDHMVSDHLRVVPAGAIYAVNFRCHHLIVTVKLQVKG